MRKWAETALVIVAGLVLAGAGPARAACHVNGGASGANDGSSWADAYVDLQSALDDPGCTEIWGAQGTYRPTTGTDRSASFSIRAGMAVHGGFAGDETTREQADPAANATLLSGDIGVPGDPADNSFHVVRMDGRVVPITRATVLDGFTITLGRASSGYPGNLSGGLHCSGSAPGGECSPTLSRLRFVDNQATYGGALFVEASGYGAASPHLRDVVFDRNTASGSGGAIQFLAGLDGVVAPLLERVTFSGNRADKGGAIHNDSGGQGGTATPSIVNATFFGNDASIGSGVGGNGGAIYNNGIGGNAAMSLVNVTLSGNTANGTNRIGGAMVNDGVGASVTIVNAIFWGNEAWAQPEIHNVSGAAPVIVRSIVAGGCPGGAQCSDVADADPQLRALEDNGGFGSTMLPGDGSPAIDGGDETACPDEDQRGFTRPIGAGCDIGAVEVVQPHVCHVNHAAAGAGNGFGWADAYVDLQAALHEPTCSEVWVAKGVYRPTTSTTDRTASFSIRPGLSVLGGFAGTETAREQADPGANRTVLSGDIDHDDATDADGVTTDAGDIAGNNSFIVVRIDGTTAAGSVGADTVLDGFVISAGSGSAGEGLSAAVAGGLYCNANASGRTCSPALRRLWFAGNRADFAGAMLLRGENGGTTKPLLRDVTFSGNRADWDAGAIYSYGFGGEASPTLINVTFSQNSAGQYGGAMLNETTLSTGRSHPVLIGVTLTGNTAGMSGGGILNDPAQGTGGSLSLTMDAVVAWGNQAPEGAQIGQLGGNGAATIRDSVIAGGCPTSFATCTHVSSADPAMGDLQDNGGPIPTRLPGVGGSAIDAGDPDTCGAAPNDFDSRGVVRPQGPGCDIGAVELRQTQLAVAVTGPGSVSGSTSEGATAASGGIVACTEEGGSCTTGYAAEPVPARVVLDLAPDAHSHLDDISDLCGADGESVGVLDDSTCTIDPLTTDCVVLASFAVDAHAVGGTVSGLAGSGLLLQINAGETVAVATDGSFAFPTALPYGSGYAVSVLSQPMQPWQTCAIAGGGNGDGSGTVEGDVSDLVVTCATDAYRVGGTVTGLTGSGLVLSLNGGETLPVPADGAFEFQTPVDSGGDYLVTITAQPDQRDCVVHHDAGTVAGGDVTDVEVVCALAAPVLALAMDPGSGYARYGRVVDYTVTLRNDGRGPVVAIPVAVALSPAFDAAFARWQCFGGEAGASCTSSGDGVLADVVTIPPARSLTWLVSVPVRNDATEDDAVFAFTASGEDVVEVVDTRVLVLLRDGFDVPYGERAVIDGEYAAAILRGDAGHAFALREAGEPVIDDVLVIAGSRETLRVQRRNVGAGRVLVRLLHAGVDGREQTSEWVTTMAGAVLSIGCVRGDADARIVLLEGADQPLQSVFAADE